MTEEVQNTRFESDDEEGRCTPSPEPESKKRKPSPVILLPADVMKGNEADYGDFVLDRTQSITLDKEDIAVLESSSGKDDSSQWKEKVLSGLLSSQENDSDDKSAKKNAAKRNNGCFNCDGDHHLNECPEPKDMKKIRQRQTEMRNNTNNTSRYHDGSANEKKYRAGRISDGLRNALGIGKHDIPEYIYRMRRMGFIKGYPPGYLKKAIERDNSNEVLTFHTLDERLASEKKSDRPDSPPPIINADKMIYYCGFNQFYRDLRDYENFRVPPFHEFVSFHQEMLNKMHEKKIEERKRIRERAARLAKKRCGELLEEGEIIILDPPPPPPPIDNEDDDDDIIIIDCDPRKTPSPPAETCNTPKGGSIGIMLGTPVLTRRTSEKKGDLIDEPKPSLENFSKGIVPFEAHEEDTPHKGFLKKIMGKLRKITR